MKTFIEHIGHEIIGKPNDRIKILDNIYNKNIINNDGKIPKTLHQIWLGKDPIPNYTILLKMWKDLHPDWEYKLWTDDDLKDFNLECNDLFYSTENLGVKSDIFRYEILYRCGGIYMDIDFASKKSFNPLIEKSNFFAGLITPAPEIINSIIGCTKENRIIKSMINGLKGIKSISNVSHSDVLKLTGPDYLTKKIFENIDKDTNDIIIYPQIYFQPMPAVYRYDIRKPYTKDVDNFINSFVGEDTYAVHLFYTTWQK